MSNSDDCPTPLPAASAPGPVAPGDALAALMHENAVLARQLAAAQARCAALGCAAEPKDTAARPARRLLHQLPAAAQELLLALSLSPMTLRNEIESVLGRVRGQPVQLQGSDGDVLASVLHDLRARNALSDHLHRRLAACHAAAVQRLAPLRDQQALRQAWQRALAPASDAPVDRPRQGVPALLWALLTHPHGQALEAQALAGARAWVYAQARRGLASSTADADQAARLAARTAEVAVLRQRLAAQQQQQEQATQAHARQLAQLAGDLQRWRALARPAVPPAGPAPAVMPAPRPPALQRVAPPSAPPREPTRPRSHPAAGVGPIDGPAEDASAAPPLPALATSPVQGRRVLCVGGIEHAVARYRHRIEALGGRFEHHDGGLHDNAHALHGRLARADLVICQAACINHAAYHRIKQHCQRTGKPCLYLERASLSRLERALQAWQPPPQAPSGPETTRPAKAGLA